MASTNGSAQRVTRYELRDASGVLVVLHGRSDGTDGKRMWWEQPDGTRGLGGMPVADLPLYGIERLDGLTSTVVIVEGEKAAQALLDAGVAAVGTVTGAATVPSPGVLGELGGRRVICWPDADAVGVTHMASIADRLAGVAAGLWLVAPPEGAPSGWDAADAIAGGWDVQGILDNAQGVGSTDAAHRSLPPEFQPKTGGVGTLLERTGAELLAGSTPTELPSLPFIGRAGYFIEGWSHLVSGYPRVGKTELLADSVAAWLALGRHVLYVTEEPLGLWEARIKVVAARWPEVPWEHLSVVIGLGADPMVLHERCFGGSEPIVVVDAARNLLGIVDENDNSAVARTLNPWVVAARAAERTLIVAHHQRKGGGEQGEGIAGGHAFLGIFDIALEVVRDPQAPRSNRRVVRPYARLVSPPELLYERADDGTFRALGDPAAVQFDEVKDRLLTVLSTDLQTTAVCHEALAEPRPSLEQVRLALLDLATAGRVERDPPLAVGSVRGKKVQWRLTAPIEATSNDEALGLEPRTEPVAAAVPLPLPEEEQTTWTR